MKLATQSPLVQDDAFVKTVGKEIIEHYFIRNFGSLSKSDLETLLFHLYVVKFSEKDDYTISKELGITQSRIRALQERSALKYPREINLKAGILTVIKSAYYSKTDKKIHCFIDDVNVQIELRHLLEEKNKFDEYSLNPKVMILPPKAFFELCDPNGTFNDILSQCKDSINGDLLKLNLHSEELTDSLSSFLASPTPYNFFSVLVCRPEIESKAYDLIEMVRSKSKDVLGNFKETMFKIFKKDA